MNIQYHYKKAAVLLKRGQSPGAAPLFFVHDGTGRIEGYFKVAELVEHSFAVYGITLDERVGYAPKNISIEELAISYIEQMKHIQPEGPYGIAGWSIGGTIAAEMARILEVEGEEIGCCVLVDAPPPGYYPRQDAQPFSAASETDYIRPFLHNAELLFRKINMPEAGIKSKLS
ncbi:thioesterase domain-containing protein [Paenibacillus elgii]